MTWWVKIASFERWYGGRTRMYVAACSCDPDDVAPCVSWSDAVDWFKTHRAQKHGG